MSKRIFKPLVLQTKQQLLQALKQGKMPSSKYNLLSKEEKLFVEMLVFGDYSAEQAYRAMKPTIKNAKAGANRMLANPDVADVLEELSIQKDKKFMAEISSSRDMALNKLKYIMNTTQDESVAAACAKIIMDKAEKIILDSTKKSMDEGVSDIKFQIQVENVNINKPDYNPKEVVVVNVNPDETEQPEENAESKLATPDDTGLNFTLSYEGLDNYHDNDND